MTYELRIPRKVAKQHASLPARARERVVERIEQCRIVNRHCLTHGRACWDQQRCFIDEDADSIHTDNRPTRGERLSVVLPAGAAG